MTPHIVQCTVNDRETLLKLSYDTFYEAFRAQNTAENMKAYTDSAFTIDRITEELRHPESKFYFIYSGDVPAGYLKVNINDAQSEPMGSDALEVQRIYVLSEYHKQGFGKALLNHAYSIAHSLKKTKVWLGVWEENDNAIGFYKKQGFKKTGSHSFFMGDDEQTDLIAEKILPSN
ncbi:Protease synthase and sporulation negative regulatory protein PAI 1 [Jeotgalicoccus saudimassiliensis]|uniref:Protease synthase and sporulation negative regulatory protein PAI 1 n=1 Tax=Jeotgalicoccus saudimassiliensis TaxID=1461582 RepID=A0A078MCV4_9STAP|nr:GNAT family N-acetyltransferase [Jeotgalicoccus saudimassiliensis]CEA02556.1 Protease synthase and sporulation negative regulatory protein PAI 1 [Jeotgalicoccus saudimassiliensis]